MMAASLLRVCQSLDRGRRAGGAIVRQSRGALPRRSISATTTKPSPRDEKASADLHKLYEEQMKEIQSERETVFGAEDPGGAQHFSQTKKPYLRNDGEGAPAGDGSSSAPLFMPPNWDPDEARAEREELYGFTDDERDAWSGGKEKSAAHFRMLGKMIGGRNLDDSPAAAPAEVPSTSFSHLNAEGDGVSMVDVGHKAATRRTALARAKVTFPPEVLSAFTIQQTELVGPKGPIFETAKIAGIMGAKQTPSLIPLCHPLPLDRVNIDIKLEGNTAVIECECRVTHKTGVEMEALTGASIAALTIYDMVKAVSHRVEIGQTLLVSKSGGKSDFKQ